jgi:hypothetical protein
MAATAPPPILAAKMTGVFSDSGNMSVILPGGEICKGGWNLVSSAPGQNSPAVNTTPAANLAPAWDTVYGPAFYTAHVLGSRLRASGTLTGNKGTTLNVELYRPETSELYRPETPELYRRYTPDGLSEIKGVATDNNGNIYKIVF